MKKLMLCMYLIWAVLGSCHTVYAKSVAPEEAKIWAEQTGYRLIEALSTSDTKMKYAQLDEMFQTKIDTAYIARFVMGSAWKKMTDDEKKKYLDLFHRYVLSLYKTYPLNFDLKGLDFTITDTKVMPSYTEVSCRVRLPDKYASKNIEYLTIAFKLTLDGSAIKITDLTIGSSSLLLVYRQRFQEMLKADDGEISWFLEDLEDQVLSNERKGREILQKAEDRGDDDNFPPVEVN